ncbi:MAG: hypothetical protein IJ353_02205 [Lachnospiraceae bacterium]|nr:hypothetical protein [Lachnospiraceae bacterium]
MRKQEIYHYYVEGEDEKKLLEVLKREFGCIESGKVDKFNAVQNKFSVARIRALKPDTIVVLIYDTDVEDGLDILQYNVDFLNQQKGIKQVVCIPQVENLEEELLRACNIKSITELTKSDSKTNYKRDLINCNNLAARLTACGFNMAKLWNRTPTNKFKRFGNEAKKIKIS